MLYYNGIDLSKGIYPTKNNISKECMIYHGWIFSYGFKFQDSICNGCDELKILRLNISDIAINIVKNADYCCIFHNISKSEEINLLKNYVLENCGYIK